VVSVDLAQGGADWTALSIVESQLRSPADGVEHRVIHLERWHDARTSLIPERVQAVSQVLRAQHAERDLQAFGRSPVTTPHISLLVDRTGVGPFGLDPLRAAGFTPIGITITGGDAVTRDDAGGYRVPKRDLAGAVQVALQARRLRVVGALPLAEALRSELQNFRAKISLSGHDSYGAGADWRVGSHDDLVLSVAMAVWFGERNRGTIEFNPPAIVAAMSRQLEPR